MTDSWEGGPAWDMSMSNDEPPWYGRPTHSPDGTPYVPPMGRYDPVFGEIALSPWQPCTLGMPPKDPTPPSTSVSANTDWITTYKALAFKSEPFPIIDKQYRRPRSKLSTPWWQKLDLYQWWILLGDINIAMEAKGALGGYGESSHLASRLQMNTLQAIQAMESLAKASENGSIHSETSISVHSENDKVCWTVGDNWDKND